MQSQAVAQWSWINLGEAHYIVARGRGVAEAVRDHSEGDATSQPTAARRKEKGPREIRGPNAVGTSITFGLRLLIEPATSPS